MSTYMVFGLVLGAIGAVAGVGSAVISGNKQNTALKAQKALAAEQKKLIGLKDIEDKRQASENYRQISARNKLNQALSGFELGSETFYQLNQQTYKDYLKDVENIGLQNKLLETGVNTQIAMAQANKPSTTEQILSSLSSGINLGMQGLQLGSAINKLPFLNK